MKTITKNLFINASPQKVFAMIDDLGVTGNGRGLVADNPNPQSADQERTRRERACNIPGGRYRLRALSRSMPMHHRARQGHRLATRSKTACLLYWNLSSAAKCNSDGRPHTARPGHLSSAFLERQMHERCTSMRPETGIIMPRCRG